MTAESKTKNGEPSYCIHAKDLREDSFQFWGVCDARQNQEARRDRRKVGGKITTSDTIVGWRRVTS